jgi:hypothetical protein
MVVSAESKSIGTIVADTRVNMLIRDASASFMPDCQRIALTTARRNCGIACDVSTSNPSERDERTFGCPSGSDSTTLTTTKRRYSRRDNVAVMHTLAKSGAVNGNSLSGPNRDVIPLGNF